MILLIDNYDSFIYNLYDYLTQFKLECKIIRNDQLLPSEIEKLNPKGIVLSPGPGRPEKSGYLCEIINFFYTKIPMLGICLGHQAIGMQFGGILTKADQPMHGKISKVKFTKNPLFDTIPNEGKVVRYHSLILKKVDEKECEIICITESGEIMGIAHKTYPIWGLQFHPEAFSTDFGLQMIGNWVKINNL